MDKETNQKLQRVDHRIGGRNSGESAIKKDNKEEKSAQSKDSPKEDNKLCSEREGKEKKAIMQSKCMVYHHNVINMTVGDKMELPFYKKQVREIRQKIIALERQSMNGLRDNEKGVKNKLGILHREITEREDRFEREMIPIKIREEDLDAYEEVIKKREGIQIPSVEAYPKKIDCQEDLIQIAELFFIRMRVQVQQIMIKKYANCVTARADKQINALWNFDNSFYFGGWNGTFEQGFKDGLAIMKDESSLYVGKFKNDKRNGYGREETFGNRKNNYYQGEWKQGAKCGIGKEIDENESIYFGEWSGNEKNGYGLIRLKCGNVYLGNFSKGLKTGKGFEVFANGDQYSGEYLNNNYHGKGTYRWRNGSEYTGDFSRGFRMGQGKWKADYRRENCESYEGEYNWGKKSGFGKYIWENGLIYEGYFLDDKKHGQGSIRKREGKKETYIWENDQILRKQ